VTPVDGTLPSPGSDELELLRRLVEDKAGLVIDDDHGSTFGELVTETLAELDLASVGELMGAVSSGSGPAFDRLVSRLTVRETYFFRNRPHFRALREVLLPELLERAARRRQLRFWSAGCSTGEEPYSLAMTLTDVARERGIDLAAWDVEIHATDINPAVLAKAREGVYGRYSFRGVEQTEIERHFEKLGDEYRVQQQHRDLVHFDVFNLKTDRLPAFGGALRDLDLIVCRNVTIYFSTETTRLLADRFFETLREGGYLIVGHSEHSLETYRRFETHALPDSILYRRGGSASLRELEGRDDSPIGQALHSLRNAAAAAPDLTKRARSLETRGGTPAIPRPGERGSPARQSLPPSLDAARRALVAGDLDRAVAVAVELLEQDSNDADAALLLGELAADRGHAAEAEVWLRRTLELRPLDLTAHYVLALLAAERGERCQALEQLGRALYVDADFLMGHYLSARLQREDGNDEAADRSLRTALRICDALPPEREVPFSEGLDVRRFRILLEGEKP
jgi:chemotaxis protein methyltransferase CheR